MKSGVVIGIIIAVVLVIAIGGYFSYKNMNSSSYTAPAAPSGNNQATLAPAPAPAPTQAASQAQTYNVEIKNFAFNPSTTNIKVGDSVTWTNNDGATHTITSDSGTELASSGISSGSTYSHTFSTAGTYNYHCSIHTSMKGTIVVS